MSNNHPKIFETGKKYTIEYFFSGENDKINIPDLQRDYCWGGNGHLVENFVESLLGFCGIVKSDNMEVAPVDSDVPIGIIYGYFDEGLNNFLQLCDGQQRMTTIFLTLGVINRMIGSDTSNIESLLMSDFEIRHDDHEPYLRYGIRESSLYFLSDLTYHYFIRKKGPAFDQIQDCQWYLHEYDFDPTIISIIAAIESISKTIKAHNLSEVQLRKFAAKISEIKLLYFDMGNREDGEKTFVIINTTGEPLSPTQNLKPIIINREAPVTHKDSETVKRRKEISQKWEEMESWFWAQRADGEETADNGMSSFFHALWFYRSSSRDEAYARYDWNGETVREVCEIPFDEIYSTFLSYCRIWPLLDKHLSENNQSVTNALSARQLYIIIPLLKFLEKWPMATDDQLRREFHIFYNMTLYRSFVRDSASMTAPAYRAKAIVESQPFADTISLIENGFDRDENFMIEERTKLEFIRNNISRRDDVETALWNAEGQSIFLGQIKEIVTASVNLSHFQRIIDSYKLLFNDKAQLCDLLRRTLLAQKFMPPSDEFWSSIESVRNLAHNPDFVSWVDKLSPNDIMKDLETKVKTYADKTDPFYLIINDPHFLDFSYSKRYIKYSSGLIDLRKSWSNNTSHLYIYQLDSINRELNLPNIGNVKVWGNGDSIWADLRQYNLWIELILAENRIVYHDDSYPARAPVLPEILDVIQKYITENGNSPDKSLTNFRELLGFIDNLFRSNF